MTLRRNHPIYCLYMWCRRQKVKLLSKIRYVENYSSLEEECFRNNIWSPLAELWAAAHLDED